ncbi:BTAD domain-containing putative transcriptional regulator [Kitasatospora sp. NPDC058218]|uniref:AfsR/SARP family transcriptional regulator n=1 Tax=Kitasatospora sp. NPDC058218 TaxID=3346385 RepID=UPI0036DDD5E4
MEFRILGALEVWVEGGPVRLGGRLQRALLAMLVVHADRVVPVARLVDAVWDETPPATAERQIRNMVGLLRRRLDPRPGQESPIVTDGPGYSLRTDRARVDARDFASQVAGAAGQGAAEVAHLRAALALWRGPALDGLPGRALAAVAAGLEEQRMSALERLFERELDAGRHREIVPELTGLVAEFPLRDHLVRHLLTALARTGRHTDGLEAYRRHAARLAEDLGLDPAPELQVLQQALLHPPCPSATHPGPSHPGPSHPGPSHPEPPHPEPPPPSPPPPGPPRPAQLPSDLPVFVGRARHLRTMDTRLTGTRTETETGAETATEPGTGPVAPGTGPPPAAVTVITGIPGVGKSALAVRWAHLARDRFPDGQLFADLHGWSPTGPRAPHAVLGAFLRALGVATEQIPAQLDEAAALYRSLLAGRRVLIVLDDARSARQVRPLLPGTGGCVAVVTSRDRLTGLVVREAAHRIELDDFTPAEGQALLARVLGAGRTAARRSAGTRLLEACGHLPLALGIAAAHLRDRPHHDIEDFATELSAAGDRLDVLDAGGDGDDQSSLRAAFDLSYRALDPAARRLFRLLGFGPAVDLTASSAAALSALDATECARLLHRLAAAHLVTERSAGRYRFHDLLRLFAAEQARREESEQARQLALRRWYAWCLRHADAAARVLAPGRPRVPPGPPPEGLRTAVFTGPGQAVQWCDDQRTNLLATVHHAFEHGHDETAWKLPALLWGYLHRSAPHVERVALGRTAAAAARRLNDPVAQGRSLNDLGHAWSALGDLPAARRHYRQALDLVRPAGARPVEGQVLANLGACHFFSGRHADAADAFEQALALLPGEGPGADRWTISLCETSLAGTYLFLGRHADAQAQADRVLTRDGSVLGGPMECSLRNVLGLARFVLGEPHEAVAHYERALAVGSRLTGYDDQRANSLVGLAAAWQALGRTDRSLRAWEAALALYRDLPPHYLTAVLDLLAPFGFTPPADRAASARRPPGPRTVTVAGP